MFWSSVLVTTGRSEQQVQTMSTQSPGRIRPPALPTCDAETDIARLPVGTTYESAASATGRDVSTTALPTTCWFASTGNFVTLPIAPVDVRERADGDGVQRHALHLEHRGRDGRALLDRHLRDDDLLVARG